MFCSKRIWNTNTWFQTAIYHLLWLLFLFTSICVQLKSTMNEWNYWSTQSTFKIQNSIPSFLPVTSQSLLRFTRLLMNHDLGGGKIKGDAKIIHIKKESIKCPEFIMKWKQFEFLPTQPWHNNFKVYVVLTIRNYIKQMELSSIKLNHLDVFGLQIFYSLHSMLNKTLEMSHLLLWYFRLRFKVNLKFEYM